MAEQDGVLYIGGCHSQIGNDTRSAGLFDLSTGLELNFPKIEGKIYSAAADGEGGWVLGGLFRTAGGKTAVNMVRIRPGGVVDPLFRPDPNEVAYNIRILGNTVFASGDFTLIGGAQRNGMAALDLSTGAALPWNPIISTNARWVSIVGADSRSVFLRKSHQEPYLEGPATFFALNPVTGATNWMISSFSGYGISGVAEAGNTLFVCGSFTNLGSVARTNVAAVDALTGEVLPWTSPAIPADARIGPIRYSCGSLIMGVSESRTNPETNSIRRIDVNTGLQTWSTRIGSPLMDLKVTPDRVISLHLAFGAVQEFDVLTGAVKSPSFQVPFESFCMAVAGSQALFAGATTGANRMSLAAIDLVTGQATPWNPVGNDLNEVRIVLPVEDKIVVAAYSGFPENKTHLTAFDQATAQRSNWGGVIDRMPKAMAYHGGKVFVGGQFTRIGGQPTGPYLAALRPQDGVPLTWPVQVDNMVWTLKAVDETLFIGGYFSNVNGQIRHGVAAVNSTTGALLPFSPMVGNFGFPFSVTAMEVRGDTLYLAGNFGTVNGQLRAGFAAVHAVTVGSPGTELEFAL